MTFQLEAHGAEVSNEDANYKFLRSLPPAWSNLAMTIRTKPDVDTLSIDDLYNNLRVFEQEIQEAGKQEKESVEGAVDNGDGLSIGRTYEVEETNSRLHLFIAGLLEHFLLNILVDPESERFQVYLQKYPLLKYTRLTYIHAVKEWGSAVKTLAGYNWRNSNCDSRPTFIRTVNAKGPQGQNPSLKKARVPKRNKFSLFHVAGSFHEEHD
ncbi:hypothetical protein Tco_0915663 [Tanacetum coccineum]